MDARGLAASVIGAAGVFVATNVDDLVVLAALFADASVPRAAIVVGQFLGIGALLLASVAASFAAVAVPRVWIALLGIVPLALGVVKGISLVREAKNDDDDDDKSTSRRAGIVGAVISVTALTLANGADNLAVYVPLLAAKLDLVGVYAVVFAFLTVAWCGAGYLMVNNPLVGARFRRYGRFALPIVLIVVGIDILAGARELVL